MNNLQLRDIKLKKIQALNRITEGIPLKKETKIQLSAKINGGILKNNSKYGVILMSTTVKPEAEDPAKLPFEIEIEINALYQSTEDVTAEFMKNYAISEGHKELWLYLKLELIRILQSMGIMVQLPTISPLVKNKANDQQANTTVFTGSEIKSN